MVLSSSRPGAPAPAGFSLVEVVIASAIFLVIAIGVLPLFTRSINSNLIGNDYMNAANHGRSGLETFHQMDFNSAALSPDPAATSKEVKDYWSQGDPQKTGDEGWLATPPTTAQTLWQRTTTVRQYSVNALADGNLKTDEALPGGTDPIFVHLKEIRIQVQSTRGGGALGGGKQITLRVLKAF